MSDLSKPTENSISLPQDSNVEDIKSVIYWLNAKPDTHIKVFPQGKLVNINDIINLNNKVQKKLENHNVFTSITTITIILDKGEILSYNLWEAFKNNTWEDPEKIESISINWDVTIKLPNYGLPQKHNLKVRIGTSLKPNEIFQILTNSDNEHELQENFSFIVCKVDFINEVISKELIQIVETWYNGLRKARTNSKLLSFVKSKRQLVSSFGDYITTSIGLALFYLAFKIHLNFYTVNLDVNLYLDIFLWFTLLFAFYLLFRVIGSSFSQFIYDKIVTFNEPHYFDITKGDKNEQDKLDEKNKKISRNLFWQFIIRLLVSIISLVASKFI